MSQNEKDTFHTMMTPNVHNVNRVVIQCKDKVVECVPVVVDEVLKGTSVPEDQESRSNTKITTARSSTTSTESLTTAKTTTPLEGTCPTKCIPTNLPVGCKNNNSTCMVFSHVLGCR